jgi:hypothetical protein
MMMSEMDRMKINIFGLGKKKHIGDGDYCCDYN